MYVAYYKLAGFERFLVTHQTCFSHWSVDFENETHKQNSDAMPQILSEIYAASPSALIISQIPSPCD
jgi:hypothetical protein